MQQIWTTPRSCRRYTGRLFTRSSGHRTGLLRSLKPLPAEPPGSLSCLKSQGDFFDRETESELLRTRLMKDGPTDILVLMGPASSGKTTLLKHVLAELAAQRVPVSYIDTRAYDMRNPDGMAKALAMSAEEIRLELPKAGLNLIDMIGLNLQVGTFNVSQPLANLLGKMFVKPKTPLTETIERYGAVIDSVPANSDVRPVLVIDEANTLSNGDPKYKEARGALLAFLVKVSKQDNSAHVVLATSDWTFRDWLRSEMNTASFSVEVIGDFSREDAKAFFKMKLGGKLNGDDDLPDDVWNRIFEVCGGNASRLLKVATKYRGNWHKVFESGVANAANETDLVEEAMWAPAGAGWTKDQLTCVMRALCDSEHGAVLRMDLKEKLGAGGTGAVAAMVKANLLGVRPGYSEWARDVPIEAWGANLGAVLITAASTAHLYAMRQTLANLDEQQDTKQDKKQE